MRKILQATVYGTTFLFIGAAISSTKVRDLKKHGPIAFIHRLDEIVSCGAKKMFG